MRSFISTLALAMPLLLGSGCGEQVGTGPPAVEFPIAQKGGLQFVTGFQHGQQAARAAKRPVLMFFTADWCTFCHQMEEDAFRDPRVQQLAKRFTCVTIDADDEPQVCQQYSVTGFPTIQLFSPQGQALQTLKGRQSSEQLLSGMNAALQRFAWLQEDAKQLR